MRVRVRERVFFPLPVAAARSVAPAAAFQEVIWQRAPHS